MILRACGRFQLYTYLYSILKEGKDNVNCSPGLHFSILRGLPTLDCHINMSHPLYRLVNVFNHTSGHEYILPQHQLKAVICHFYRSEDSPPSSLYGIADLSVNIDSWSSLRSLSFAKSDQTGDMLELYIRVAHNFSSILR